MTRPVMWSPSAHTALDRFNGKLFATTTECAAVLRYDRRTLMRGISSGEIPSVRVGTTYRIPTRWIYEQAGLSAGAAS